MQTTIEAVYDNGEFILEQTPDVKKAKVLITFVEDLTDETKKERVKFPTKKLGKMKKIDRGELYGDYLSDRY